MDDSSSPLVGKPHPAACYAGMAPLQRSVAAGAARADRAASAGRRALLRAVHASSRAIWRGPIRSPRYDELRDACHRPDPRARRRRPAPAARGSPQLSAAATSQRPGDDAPRAAFRCPDDGDAAARPALVLLSPAAARKPSAVAGAMAYAHDDMLFPSYRQPGLLLVRGMPLVTMMCQIDRQPLRPTQGPADAGALQLAGRQRGFDLEPRRHAVAAGGRRGDGVCLSRRAARRRRVDRRRHRGPGRFPSRAQFRVRLSAAVRAARGRQPMGDQHASQHSPPAARTFAARADAYRLPGLRVDGNDFLAVYAAEQWAIERARRGGGPTLVELVTYRCDAHSTSDDTSQYRPTMKPTIWPGGDPIERLKRHLIGIGEWSEKSHTQLNAALEQEVARHVRTGRGLRLARQRRASIAPNAMFEDVYATMPDHLQRQFDELQAEISRHEDEPPILPFAERTSEPSASRSRCEVHRRSPDSPDSESLRHAHDEHDSSDSVRPRGDARARSERLRVRRGRGLLRRRVSGHAGLAAASSARGACSIRRSPRAASSRVAIGMGINGLRPVPEIQFSDYMYPAFDQITNELAKLRYRSGGEWTAPLTIRTPCGGGIRGGLFHSQSPEAYYTHTPGLCVVMPSNPYDAKGLLISSIESDDPVIFFEPKRLYRGPFDGDPEHVPPWRDQPAAEVPEGHYRMPLGKASIVRPGEEVTVITWGTMVHVARAAIEESQVDAELIDLRTLVPLDLDDDHRLGRKDRPLRRRARSAADVRLRRRSRRARAATLLLQSGSARSNASPVGTRRSRTPRSGSTCRAASGSRGRCESLAA